MGVAPIDGVVAVLFFGGGVTTWGLIGFPAQILIILPSRWTSPPFTRSLVEDKGLVHISTRYFLK